MITKGEALDTEDFSLRSDERIRISIVNVWTNQQFMLGVTPDGRISIKAKRNMNALNSPMENLFEGTYEEFLARLV